MESSVEKKRSKKIYVLWGIALALLLVIGLLCWLYVAPLMHVRVIAAELNDNLPEAWSETDEDRMAHLKRAIEALGGRASAARAFGMYLGAPDSVTPHKAAAIWGLGHCGNHAYKHAPAITAALGHDHAHVRWIAAISLGQLGNPVAVDGLLELLDDNDLHVRMCAIDALGRIGAPRAADALVPLLVDKSATVRSSTREALASIRDKHLPPDIAGDARLQETIAAVEACAPAINLYMGNYQISAIIGKPTPDKIEAVSGTPELRWRGSWRGRLYKVDFEWLSDSRTKSPVLEFPFATAVTTDPDKVSKQLRTLGGKEASAKRIARYLRLPKRDAPRKLTAVLALYFCREQAGLAGNELVSVMKDTAENVRAREEAAYRLAKLGDAASMRHLTLALTNSDEDTRGLAVWALGSCRKSQAVEPLSRGLTDTSADVRAAAAHSLGLIGGARAIKALESASRDKDPEVCKVISIVLKDLKGKKK